MSKKERLNQAYKDIKAGFVINCNGTEIWIATCDRPNAPDYGKEYIYWYGYGSSAESVSKKKLAFVMGTIAGSKDYQFDIVVD